MSISAPKKQCLPWPWWKVKFGIEPELAGEALHATQWQRGKTARCFETWKVDGQVITDFLYAR